MSCKEGQNCKKGCECPSDYDCCSEPLSSSTTGNITFGYCCQKNPDGSSACDSKRGICKNMKPTISVVEFIKGGTSEGFSLKRLSKVEKVDIVLIIVGIVLAIYLMMR